MSQKKRNSWLSVVCILFFTFLAGLPLSAATLTGSLTEDEVWSGTVLLTGDVTVPVGGTLTIDPDTTIVFPAQTDDTGSGNDSALSELLVSGSLIASGSVGSPITFTSSASTPAKGDWGGIRVTSLGSLTLSHTVIEYGQLGVRYESSGSYSEVHITDSTIRQTNGIGIYVYVSSGTARTVEIVNNHVHDHNGQGIYLRGSGANTVLTGTVSGNEVHATGNSGIYFYTHGAARSELTVDSNTVYTTQNHGIYSYAINASTVLNGVFSNNEIRGTTTGLYLYNQSSATSQSLSIRNNTIHNTTTGIYCYSNYRSSMSPSINDNNLYENSSIGLDIYGSQGNLAPFISHNQITANGTGIRVRWSYNHTVTPKIVLNTVTGNTGVGVSVQCNGVPTILHNNIQGNGGNGLNLNNSATSHVHYNNISNNSGSYELHHNAASVVDARYNWWGDQATGQMDSGNNPKNISRIFDIFDDGSKGGIDYSEWLSSAQTLIGTPVSWLLDPVDGASFKGGTITIHGAAVSLPGIERIEVSTDNGQSWQVATGKSLWSYQWTPSSDGSYVLQSRIVSSDSTIEQASGHHTVTVDSTLPTTTGVLSEDETWSGEILLTGDVTVPAGVTLTLDPGTTIRFQALSDDQSTGTDTSRSELLVSGSLSAIGSVGSPITFTSSADTPAKGDWGGIRVTGEGALTLSHTVIEYGELGIRYESSGSYSEVHITDSTVRESLGIGIYVYVSSGTARTVEIVNNHVHNHSSQGIYLRGSGANTVLTGTVSGNEVHATGNSGIYFYTHGAARSELTVDSNTVYTTQNHGIYSYAVNGSTVLNGVFSNNEIRGTTTGLYLYNHSSATSQSLSIRNNTIHNTGTGLYCYSNYRSSMSPSINDNNLYENSSIGLDIYGSQGNLAPFISDNQITANGTGIRVRWSYNHTVTPKIVLNTVTGNTGVGVSVQCNGVPTILHNNIQGNGGNGLNLNNSATSHVHYNNISNNSGSYELHHNAASVVDARYNWWGDQATGQMDSGNNPKNISRIFDIFDDGSKGGVDYSQWLSSAQTLTETPVSWLLDPVDGASFKGGTITIHGAAVSLPGIERVEVSTDNGQSWQVATGKSLWNYDWTPSGDGTYVLQSRVISSDSTIEQPSGHHTVTVDINAMTVSGTLSHDETWSGQVIVEGDVIIPDGVTLTIQPGATILVPTLSDGGYGGNNGSKSELIVNGTLFAEGTVDQPISFVSTTEGGGQAGDWRGITVTGSLFLRYVDLQHAETAIVYIGSDDGSQLSVRNSLISNCSGHGLDILANNGAQVTVTVDDNTLVNNDGYGITCRAAQAGTALQMNFCNNTIGGNGNIAIYVYADGSSGDPVVTGSICNNTIYNHLTHGISLYTYHGARSELTVDNNEVYQSAKGVFARYNTSNAASTLVVTSNDIHTGQSGLSIQIDSASLSPSVENNEVHGHTGNGISITHGGQSGNILLPQLLNNQIYENDGIGVYLQPTAEIAISNNGMFGNSQYDLYNKASFTINASSNWWGVDTTNIINNSNNPTNLTVIYDTFDNGEKGEVDYSDWLTLYDPPALPTLELVTTPTSDNVQTLSGTKEADSGIMINGTEVVVPDQETTWSYDLDLAEGNNSLSIRSRTSSGMVTLP